MNPNSIHAALMELRCGYVLTPGESVEASSMLPGAPTLKGYSLMVKVPRWLLAELESDTQPLRKQFGLLTTQDNATPALFMLTVQRGSTQLRLLMHINDACVQSLLSDSWSRGQLDMVLLSEQWKRGCILAADMPSKTDTLLPRTLEAARDAPGQLAQVLELGARHTLPEAVASLLEDVEVTKVVTVLVTDTAGQLTDEELAALTGDGLYRVEVPEHSRRLH